ncbi:hypothetical protein [Larkinella soli]|uniref:hypothetical protein n=1 Tax=Larkinella soli TaxID=1770527 RepID=UPI000FFC38F7|nr:hypothetical protein [Larkinella soli]
MKRHPVDDLFASRLRDHSLKPERASWNELQRRMQGREKERRSFVWWYAAAAGIAVVLLAGWWVWSGLGTEVTGSQEKTVAQAPGRKPVPAITEPAPAAPRLSEAEAKDGPVPAYRKPERAGETARNKGTDQPAPAVPSAAEAVAAAVVPDRTPSQLSPENPVADQPVVAAVIDKQPEKTLVVQLPMPTPAAAETEERMEAVHEIASLEEQPRKKRIRLGRILRQFNNLKAGEPVEWEEVGVNPGTILAKASEKVHEGKDKISSSIDNLRYNTFKKNVDNK